ncbi:hypothetical protein H8356DRAFT_1285945 [Neocallimastix lanati (nom. inval.)]|uniref:WD40 repeat-like protein n=1 Tax=Neocallimastix californiae TaxID=1754190 RepID=A0A1Y2F5I7_9FUNG|nr:hypothetical protein H8356DRAFT_1285945 [Neocallimastix sp. JGI-2020a]ORY78744.1 hypothetical protein LY90DRAFT_500935 [Neocallimastix californiae]|eukprot:ORY78744.1 hypothetical protein LY90DRAFT_500935 [Neocallimastix californiae]
MTENRIINNDNKKKLENSKYSFSNYNNIINNFINLKEKDRNRKKEIEDNVEMTKIKKQKLSSVFDIGEKSPYKFNEKMLGNDIFNKYISPTITPDNRKYNNKKKEIGVSNQPLISPIAEEQLQGQLKLRINNKTQIVIDKSKNSKNKKNENNKKKGKNKYELQFKSEAKHINVTSLSNIKDSSINEKIFNKTGRIIRKINEENFSNTDFNNNLNEISKPIHIIITDENGVENKQKENNEVIEIDDSNPYENIKKEDYLEENNIENEKMNILLESEPLSTDLFKDIEDEFLLSSKLSDNDTIKEDNVNLINNFDNNDIIISPVNINSEENNEILISDDDIKGNLDVIEDSLSKINDNEKIKSPNYINNINFDDYDNQVLMNNSQIDDLSFDGSQINKIGENINDNDKNSFLSLNKLEYENINNENGETHSFPLTNIDNFHQYNYIDENEELILQNNNKKENGKIRMLNDINSKNELKVNNNKEEDTKKTEPNTKENLNNLEENHLNENLFEELSSDNNTQYKMESSESIGNQNKINNYSNIQMKNSFDHNEPKIKNNDNISINKSNNKKPIIINHDNKFLNKKDSSSSSLIHTSSSSLSYHSSINNINMKNDYYKINVYRLKSQLIVNKNHKNKETINEYDCSCFHVNNKIKKIVTGKYATNVNKNLLIMETDTSIEIWKYDIEIDSLCNKGCCKWKKYPGRLKNFCEKIEDIQISPSNEYMIIIGSNYNPMPKHNYYRCGLIIDIYTLNEIYLDININGIESSFSNYINNEYLSNEQVNSYSYPKICFAYNQYNIKNNNNYYEKASDIVFIPGYANGQLIEFTIKKNLSSNTNSYIYPIPKNSSSPLLSILSYDNKNNHFIIGLMKDEIALWNINTKEIFSVISLNSVPLNKSIKLISSIVPPEKYINNLNTVNNRNSKQSKNDKNLNNYISLILYITSENRNINENQKSLNEYEDKKTESIDNESTDNYLKDDKFGIYTFLNNQLKDQIYYQTSLPDDSINDDIISCYEDSENYIFVGYESGKIMVWEKNSKEIAALLNLTKDCYEHCSTVLNLINKYDYKHDSDVCVTR